MQVLDKIIQFWKNWKPCWKISANQGLQFEFFAFSIVLLFACCVLSRTTYGKKSGNFKFLLCSFIYCWKENFDGTLVTTIKHGFFHEENRRMRFICKSSWIGQNFKEQYFRSSNTFNSFLGSHKLFSSSKTCFF